MDNWLEKESEQLIKEMKNKPCKKYMKYENQMLNKAIILLIIITLFNLPCFSSMQNGNIECDFWGDTWTCPNENCGYENYEAIRYCALCGSPHP